MLESIRGFAAERLAADGEAPALRARHADYFRALAERMDAALRAGEPEEGPVAVLAADIGNLRAAVEFGLATGDTEVVRQITAALHMYWDIRGLYTEARSWQDRALALTDVQDVTRQRLLSAQACTARTQGDYRAAQAASDEAASLAMTLAGETELFESLQARVDAAESREDLRSSRGAAARSARRRAGRGQRSGDIVGLPAEPGRDGEPARPPRRGRRSARREPAVRAGTGADPLRGVHAGLHGRHRPSGAAASRTAPRPPCSARPARCRSATNTSRPGAWICLPPPSPPPVTSDGQRPSSPPSTPRGTRWASSQTQTSRPSASRY